MSLSITFAFCLDVEKGPKEHLHRRKSASRDWEVFLLEVVSQKEEADYLVSEFMHIAADAFLTYLQVF